MARRPESEGEDLIFVITEEKEMLILSRQKEEAIILRYPKPNGGFDSIRITVTDIKPARVKLGIAAPEEVQVKRSELVEGK